jgi:AcrR family transcriptional regulator
LKKDSKLTVEKSIRVEDKLSKRGRKPLPAGINEKDLKPKTTKLTRVKRELPAKESKRLSSTGINTQQGLLDAAEVLFAEHGYEGTSLRDIAEAANEHVGLTTYYFKTKEQFFESVIERRATDMHRYRLTALSQIDFAALTFPESVRAIIWAWAGPMITARSNPSVQWRAHVRLMASVMNQKRWVPLIRKHYDPSAAVFIASYRRLLPEANFDSLLDAFSFTTAVMQYVCSYTDRFGHWKENKILTEAEVLKIATENFLDFSYAGFLALAQKGASTKAASGQLDLKSRSRFGII